MSKVDQGVKVRLLRWKATQLAGLIFDKLEELRHRPLNDASLGTLLSLMRLKDDADKGRLRGDHLLSLEPRIDEVILFGSVAAGRATEVSDIDLIVIDNGHFSDFLPVHQTEALVDDLYLTLAENLPLLMGMWFEVSTEKLQAILGGTSVDLHMVPRQFLQSADIRREITGKHKDPDFFRNAFGEALRFNRSERQFEPLTLEYLEGRFRCRLDDLR